ncbi:arylsulfotransferase [Penicillium waksmanii]|uniref:arylsulfotransferase n=1 Tax=Penicillium waksmanii TaxID=69791 RepID=UPI0025495533|nr:arylsulfotransferase [Penicillium waksmanii]KAJ6000598.1 arylsulfotransferase [Penicillium waksmanii]
MNFYRWMVLPFIWASIAVLAAGACGDFVSTNYDEYNDGVLGHRPHLEFHSSDEYAPIMQATVWDSDAISDAGSHIFLRHDGNDTSPLASPLIIDARDLSAVYMNRTFKNVFGTRVQENKGKKYLTFWEGEKGNGIGDGYGLAYDDTYRLVYKVSAQNIQVHSDLHEFAFTGNGSALVTGVNSIQVHPSMFPQWELPPFSIEILDAVFQEIDLETNEVLFHWRALDHINPLDSYESMGRGWDAYHINSIEKTQAGNYLISIRHTFSILLISGSTGEIIWQMGGKRNDFDEIPVVNGSDTTQAVLTMSWQHHARFVPGTNETQITLFDNHGTATNHGDCKALCSRGLHFAINDTISPPTVKFLREFRHPAQLQAQSQGSVQPLSPSMDGLGNVFIGWGRCPSFTEHNSQGETVMDIQFSPWHSDEIPDALDNYRAYKMNWSATPWWDPAIAMRKTQNGELVVYLSWNGATEVAGDYDKVVTEGSRTGFETKLIVGETPWQYLWAEAVDKAGDVLRSTDIVDLTTATLPIVFDTYDANFTFPSGRVNTQHVAQPLSMTSVLLLTGIATVALVVFSIGAEDFDLGLEELLDDDKQNDSDDGDIFDDEGDTLIASQSLFQDHDGRPLLPRNEGNIHPRS